MCRAALEEQEEEEEAEEGPKGPQRGVYPRDFGRQSTKAPVREERGFRCAPFASLWRVKLCLARADGCAAPGRMRYTEAVLLAFGAVHLGISRCAVVFTVSGVRSLCAYREMMMLIQDHLKLLSSY